MNYQEKKTESLILHVKIKDAITNDSRKIVDGIFLLKSAILKSLPACRVLVTKPKFWGESSNVALMIRNLNKYLSNLRIECIEKGNINDRQLSKKGYALNSLNQIRKFWCSVEYLSENPLSFEIIHDTTFQTCELSDIPICNRPSTDNIDGPKQLKNEKQI